MMFATTIAQRWAIVVANIILFALLFQILV